MGQWLRYQPFDSVHHVALVVSSQKVDSIAVRVSAVPILVDFLPHPERRNGEVMGQTLEARLVLDVNVLAPHVPV